MCSTTTTTEQIWRRMGQRDTQFLQVNNSVQTVQTLKKYVHFGGNFQIVFVLFKVGISSQPAWPPIAKILISMSQYLIKLQKYWYWYLYWYLNISEICRNIDIDISISHSGKNAQYKCHPKRPTKLIMLLSQYLKKLPNNCYWYWSWYLNISQHSKCSI